MDGGFGVKHGVLRSVEKKEKGLHKLLSLGHVGFPRGSLSERSSQFVALCVGPVQEASSQAQPTAEQGSHRGTRPFHFATDTGSFFWLGELHRCIGWGWVCR